MHAPTEPFRVGIVPGVTVTKWTRAWKDRRPGHPLEVVRLSEDEQADALASGLVDVCFARLPLADDELNIIRLYSEVPVAVVAKEHPLSLFDSITLADLEGEVLRTEPPEDAVEVVAAGAGVLLVPHSIARLHGRKDVAAVPITDAASTDVAIAWPLDGTTEDVEFFVGIVRGRTAASSRGADAAAIEATKPATKPGAKSSAGRASAASADRSAAAKRRGTRATRGGRRGRG